MHSTTRGAVYAVLTDGRTVRITPPLPEPGHLCRDLQDRLRAVPGHEIDGSVVERIEVGTAPAHRHPLVAHGLNSLVRVAA